MDVFYYCAAAGEDFVGQNQSQRALSVCNAAGEEFNAAGAAIAAAALVFDCVAGALQGFEQGFTFLQGEAGAVCGDLGHGVWCLVWCSENFR